MKCRSRSRGEVFKRKFRGEYNRKLNGVRSKRGSARKGTKTDK